MIVVKRTAKVQGMAMVCDEDKGEEEVAGDKG